MSKTNAIDPNVPAGSEDPKLGDNRIRNLAAGAIEILAVNHYVGSDGGSGTGYDEDAAGEHAVITLRVQSTPTAEASKGKIYTKTVSGVPELMFQDKDGNEIQLTSGGAFNISLLTSKTITTPTLTSPVINTGVSGTAILDEDTMASNSDTQLATQQSIKAYIDAQITASIQNILGTPESKISNTIYQASTAGFAFGLGQPGHGNGVFGYIGASSPPASLVQGNSVYETGYGSAFICVPKNYYWTITGAGAVYWIPFGS